MTRHPITEADRARLLAEARDVLQGNRAGDSTKPSPDLYPHQWNWDSCFIAIGLSRYDPARAQKELLALLRGQWSNGMVPQIVFNPAASGYFPGPDVWQSQRSPEAPQDVATSGITQPPVLAIAALAACRNDPDQDRAKAFASQICPRVAALHEFLYRERNPDGSGLIVVLHPWECGLDNTPPYLDAGSRVHLTYKPQYKRLDTLHVNAASRPSDKDYDLFVWLLEQMREKDYNWAQYLSEAQLQIEDVLFNSILCRACEALAELAEIARLDPAPSLRHREQTAKAIRDKLWDEASGAYYHFDRVAGKLLKEDTVSGYVPLYSSVPSAGSAQRLLQDLRAPNKFWPSEGYPVPTTSLDSSWFSPENYWRGPVWVNTNWLLREGLLRYGERELAQEIEEATIQLVAQSGFREYFNPLTGEGYGTNRFSWTAALTIDLLSSRSSL